MNFARDFRRFFFLLREESHLDGGRIRLGVRVRLDESLGGVDEVFGGLSLVLRFEGVHPLLLDGIEAFHEVAMGVLETAVAHVGHLLVLSSLMKPLYHFDHELCTESDIQEHFLGTDESGFQETIFRRQCKV